MNLKKFSNSIPLGYVLTPKYLKINIIFEKSTSFINISNGYIFNVFYTLIPESSVSHIRAPVKSEFTSEKI